MLSGIRRRRRRPRPGTQPGAIQVDPRAPATRLRAIAYGPDEIVEHEGLPADFRKLTDDYPVVWINVEGLGDAEVLEALGAAFHIHPLALEDVVNSPQRPKIEAYDERLFVVVQMLSRSGDLFREQLSLCLGDGFLVTFQEREGDPFGPVRERLRKSRGRLRNAGADYLAYALLDAVVDRYFPFIDSLEESLEQFEEELRKPSSEDPLARIQAARAELREVRRAIVPVREVTRSLTSGEWPHLLESTQLFLRDCHDHVLEAVDQLDACREIAASLMDIHLSTVSHQANETMKVLTVIATIFMPLTFIVGIYGMNFNPDLPGNMPELNWPYGYVLSLLVMTILGLGLALFFKRKGWF